MIRKKAKDLVVGDAVEDGHGAQISITRVHHHRTLNGTLTGVETEWDDGFEAFHLPRSLVWIAEGE